MSVAQKCQNVTTWLVQIFRKESLRSIIGGVIIGVVVTVIANWIQSPPSIPQQIRKLNNPSPPFTAHFWIDAPGKTVFHQNDRVTLFYKVTGFRKNPPLCFTLLHISDQGVVSPLLPLSQKEIHANQEYTLPEQLPAGDAVPFKPIETHRLTLNTVGKEYFKAIVTSECIGWEELLKRIQEKVQPVSLWATSELTVDVKPMSKNQ